MSDARALSRRLETLSEKQRRLLELRLARERGAPGSEDKPAGAGPIPVLPRTHGAFPLSFAQARLWFLDQLEPGSPWYNLPIPLRLRGRLRIAALAAAFAELERRHEPLRTTFTLAGASNDDGAAEEAAVQVIGPPRGLPMPLVDLKGLRYSPGATSDPEDTELLRLARAEAGRPFDLARGLLVRGLLFAVGEGDHALILNQHHIVCDGWSLGVLVREMGALYQAFLGHFGAFLNHLRRES